MPGDAYAQLARSFGACRVVTALIRERPPCTRRQAPVNEFMTSAADLQWAETDFPAMDALRLLHTERIRHLPVVRLASAASAAPEPPELHAMISMRELLGHLAWRS